MERIFRLLSAIYEKTDRHRTLILCMSVIVVFAATYLLVLPAFTLDKDEAVRQGGADIAGIESEPAGIDPAQNGDADRTEGNFSTDKFGIEESAEPADKPDSAGGNNPAEDNDSRNAASDDSDRTKEEHSADKTDMLVFEGDGYDITVEDANGVLPDGTELEVREISAGIKKDAKEYEKLSELAADALRTERIIGDRDEISFAKLYDITLSADGKEIEPDDDESVGVSISYDRKLQKNLTVENADNVHIIHFAENAETGEIITEIYDNQDVDITVRKDRLARAEFTADTFSVYAVVYTVDFSYSVNGETYEFALAGGEKITLSELAANLGIVPDTKFRSASDFIAEVKNLEFSDPALVRITPVTKRDAADSDSEIVDWELESLNAFKTEEKLTITMKNGDVLVVSVTDAQHVDSLALMLESAAVYEDGNLIPWPATVRENKYYDIRLTFKEDSVYQFLDTADEMYYPVPEGLDLGGEDFAHEFAMDVGDGVKLEGNTVKYDAATNRFVVKWNTRDKAAFNKLIASNSADFRLDFKAKFDFTKDNIEFSENVTGKVIKDTTYDVDVDKTGVYNEDENRIDYTVTVTSYGESKDIKVKDELFGTALSYISGGDNHGVSWNAYDAEGNPKTNGTIGQVTVLKTNSENYPDREAGIDCGFELTVGKMSDGEKIEFTYSAAVDYDKLTGSGTYDETFNKVVVTTPAGEKEKDHSFTGSLHYVKLQKDHERPINWTGDNATVRWSITVNEDCKVGMKGTEISDRIYAGDIEAMEYSGDGLHVAVYDYNGAFVGAYDVPWNDESITKNDLGIDTDTDEIEYASWHYTIPDKQTATDGDGNAVNIDNSKHYKYVVSYTTDADKSLMVFDGYIGNEASENKTDNEMQDGFYPPGTGTMPEVTKSVEPQTDPDRNAPNGSNEEYIYWTISFDRQRYDLTRCVIEDNNPTLWGTAEPVDVSETDGGYEYLYVDGLTDGESWEISSATDTRTTIKFYKDSSKTKPGLLRASDGYTGEDGTPSNTITIHLRTRNSATWLDGTLTKYWPKDHTNTVTWIPNAHQVEADATATPDVRKIIKNGVQVGTIIRDGVSLPVFRYELFLVGLDENSFPDEKLVLDDKFDTSKLELIDPNNLTEANGFEYTQALQENMGNNRIWTYWDQKLKGYGAVSGWVGPVPTVAQSTETGLRFTINKSDFDEKGLELIDGEKVYCLRYGLPYYLVVKDAEAAREIAKETIEAGKDTAEFKNTVTWNNDSNLTDSTMVEAEFKPAQKSVLYNDQRDLATYQLTLNPQGMNLNDGQMIRVEDAYENLAVDFSTVDIKTVPEDRASLINWSYHSNKGTFWIPDETVVIITYQAQPIGDAGKNVTIKNELTMLTWKETVEKTVTLNSESEGSAGDYNIRLFKYKDDFMNQPLSGAVFQLFEAGNGAEGDIEKNGRWYKPVTYQTTAKVDKGSEEYEHTASDIIADDEFLQSEYPTRLHHSAGDFIYFSTGNNGYSDIHLSQSRDGLALERGKQYYLYEVVTPDGYDKEDIYWSFIIDDMDFFDSAHGIYQYRDGGVLTVSNESSQDKGIVISKTFTGDARDALNWNQVEFEIVGSDKDGNTVFKRDVSFADFVKYKLKLPALPGNGNGPYTYTITEKNADVATATRTTTASVTKTTAGDINNDGEQIVTLVEPTESKSTTDGYEVSFTVTDDDLKASSETAFKVAFENNYVEKPIELTLNKEWGSNAATLKNKTLTLALYKDGEEYPLYKDGDVYKPVDLCETNPKPEAERIVLNDTTGWTVRVTDLPRYENGKPINWTVREVGASFKQDGNPITVAEADMDMQFTITASMQTGTDEEGEPITKTIKVEHGEAAIDSTSAEKANLTFNNELSTMTTVKVEKKWYDEKGNDVTSSKTADDAVTYDLYRTTDELPKGGKERKVFTIASENNDHIDETDVLTESIEILGDDVINIHIVPGNGGLNSKGEPWNGSKNYNFAGIYAHVNGAIVDGNVIWNYPFDVIKITGFDGENTKDLTDNRGGKDRNVAPNGYYIDGFTYWGQQYEYIDIQVRMTKEYYELIDRYDNNGNPILWLRNWYWARISVTNLTQESENLTHAKLEKFVSEHSATTELFRENLTLGELEEWNSVNNYPDGYTYFAIEHTPAGYEDTYSVVDTLDDDGKVTGQTITIDNSPVKIEDGQELGTLTVQKAVTGLPNTSEYNNKEYQFRIRNGAKYLVKTGESDGKATYELMSIAQLTTAGKTLEADATYTIKAGENNKLTFGGLYPAIYTIEEVGNPQAEGFTLETGYSGNGRIGVNLGQISNAAITNTYTPETTKATFGKLWADGDNKPVIWPEGQSIEVVVHRYIKDTANSEDKNFAITCTIDANGTTIKSSEIPDLEKDTDIVIEPVTDHSESPYYAYRYQLSGLAKKVLTGSHAGEEWTYYVTEIVPSGAAYEAGYGNLNGTSASVVNEKTNAGAASKIAFTEADYVINRFSPKEVTFTKNWFDGVNNKKLSTWPQREKPKELDENGNVIDPAGQPEYEDVPITITLRRKLAYGIGGLQLTDYDPTYSVRFENLTSLVTSREQNTSEGKLTLKLESAEGNFRYTISGLRDKGELEGHSGEWKYYIVESTVDGYDTSYVLKNNGASDGSYTDEGGIINNTKKLGTIVIEKKAEGLPESENGKEFSFTVRSKAEESKYLTQNGDIAANEKDAIVSIKSGDKAIFKNVPAGEYTIAELGTDANGAAQVYGYSLDVSADKGWDVSIADDDVKTVTVTNTYTPETKDFSFTKVWFGVDWSNPEEWQAESITVTLNRSFTTAGGSEINGDPITMTIYPQGGSGSYDYTVTKISEPKISYEMKIQGLEKFVPKDKLPAGTESGEWTYTLVEGVPSGYYAHYFMKDSYEYRGAKFIDDGGTIENYLETFELPSTGGQGKTIFYILGAILILVPGLLVWRRRRVI